MSGTRPDHGGVCVQGRYVQIVVERQQRERDLREKAERDQADRVRPFPLPSPRRAAPLFTLFTLIYLLEVSPDL